MIEEGGNRKGELNSKKPIEKGNKLTNLMWIKMQIQKNPNKLNKIQKRLSHNSHPRIKVENNRHK